MKQKKAVSLPINVVVMMIIGIIIFGLGISLFTQISNSAENTINDRQEQIRKSFAKLECNGDEWICSPTNEIRNGNTDHFALVIANRGTEEIEFEVEIDYDDVDGKKGLTKSCGSILLFPYPKNVKIKSGESTNFPLSVTASRVAEVPCSFTTSAILRDYSKPNEEIERTPIIIRVE